MSLIIKQSTAVQNIVFFMTLSSDHISPATGKSPAVTLSKNGGAFASATGAVTEIANGWYKLAADATDSNTLGALALHATAASCDATDMLVGTIVAFDPQAVTRTPKRRNTAQAGSSTTITLDASATTAHCGPGDRIDLESGPGAGNSNWVKAFDAATKIATMVQAWPGAAGNPAIGTVFQVWAAGGAPPVVVTAHDDGTLPASLDSFRGVTATGTGYAGDPIRPTGVPASI